MTSNVVALAFSAQHFLAVGTIEKKANLSPWPMAGVAGELMLLKLGAPNELHGAPRVAAGAGVSPGR